MQKTNVNLPITVTARHMEITDAIRDYAIKRVSNLHLDYPKIIEAKVIVDAPDHRRQMAEILLFCANHIHIEASSETEDLYKSIDETVAKIARRMRKYKTRLLKSHRPRKDAIRHLEEQVYKPDISEEAPVEEPVPHMVHKENYRIRRLYTDEAILELEVSERPFVVYENARTEKLTIVFRRPDGDYGKIEP